VIRVARLEDDRPSLGAARHVEPAADVEVSVRVGERPRVGVVQEDATLLVGDDLVTPPRVEEDVRRLEEALGALVALVFGQVPTATKVLPGERIP
jgi:hypothetical protein